MGPTPGCRKSIYPQAAGARSLSRALRTALQSKTREATPLRSIATAGTILLGMLVTGRVTADDRQTGRQPASPPTALLREPGVLEVSAAEQSDWLDENLPKLLAITASSPEVRARIAGSLAAVKASPTFLMPLAPGLAPGDLERLSAVVHAAVAANRRYGQGASQAEPDLADDASNPYCPGRNHLPGAPASDDLEPGPSDVSRLGLPRSGDRPCAILEPPRGQFGAGRAA